MGKEWDGTGVAFDPATWAEVSRVMKPGAHLLAFGGTRTFHRMTVAIEDAGFEIRDCLAWLYGSGFPKSKNIGDGRGTALKPAWEPIILARKPLSEATVEANVKRWGVGCLWIDEGRIGNGKGGDREGEASAAIRYGERGVGFQPLPGVRGGDARGRWPANVLLDTEAADLLDLQSGDRKAGGNLNGDEPSTPFLNCYGEMNGRRVWESYDDSGGASRFFYVAKASRAERNAGCDSLPKRIGRIRSETSGQHITRRDGGAPGPRGNHHPTVKPAQLMRYLCRLVAPKNGTVLDCFTGSGSTGMAAVWEGMNFIGVEREVEYLAIARARIAWALDNPQGGDAIEWERRKPADPTDDHPTLFAEVA